MKYAKYVLAVLVAGSALAAVPALADPPSAQNPVGRILGVVPAKSQASKSGGGSNLVYHNGPVMQANQVYAIYWVPNGYSVSANYESLIDRFFTDVAAASGQTSNVYYSDTQYYDVTGAHIQYSSSHVASVVDTDPLPPSGCSDSYTSVCVTDAQIQSELQSVMAAHGWTGGADKAYFVFTAKGIGSCSGSSCAFSNYCAYHSWIGSGSSATMYANMPYADTVPSACDAGQHPNNDDADATINVTSHEHNESITDPQGSAWYDRRGYENGDKCAWNFGSQLGSTAYGQYNQLINGDPYELQQEWSNHSSACVLQGT